MAEEENETPDLAPPPEAADAVKAAESAEASAAAAGDEADAPVQLGAKRFVYAAYFGGGLLAAFLFSKFGSLIWYRVDQWKPMLGLGEPKEEMLLAAGAVVGALGAVYYWRKDSARKYVEEVADELGKVTWPSRKEVTNSTAVVVVTTLVATVFFALMDRFWGFVTNLVYGGAT